MSTPERGAGRTPEDEGVPDLQDGTPEQQWAGDPQQMPLPGERPVASEDYGTTVDEELAGEPLAGRLAREQPGAGPDTDPLTYVPPAEPGANLAEHEREAGRLVEPDEDAHGDRETDMVADLSDDDAGLSAEEAAVHLSDEERVRLDDHDRR